MELNQQNNQPQDPLSIWVEETKLLMSFDELPEAIVYVEIDGYLANLFNVEKGYVPLTSIDLSLVTNNIGDGTLNIDLAIRGASWPLREEERQKYFERLNKGVFQKSITGLQEVDLQNFVLQNQELILAYAASPSIHPLIKIQMGLGASNEFSSWVRLEKTDRFAPNHISNLKEKLNKYYDLDLNSIVTVRYQDSKQGRLEGMRGRIWLDAQCKTSKGQVLVNRYGNAWNDLEPNEQRNLMEEYTLNELSKRSCRKMFRETEKIFKTIANTFTMEHFNMPWKNFAKWHNDLYQNIETTTYNQLIEFFNKQGFTVFLRKNRYSSDLYLDEPTANVDEILDRQFPNGGIKFVPGSTLKFANFNDGTSAVESVGVMYLPKES